jgi:hypothetical protein
LIIYWIAFEQLHLNWELSWTWLNLGNGFSNNILFIQYKSRSTWHDIRRQFTVPFLSFF